MNAISSASTYGCDVIGDVHGQLEALQRLLGRLGYEMRGGAYRHPEGRVAVFVGDLIDRGPNQLGTIDLVRRMREAGSAYACMGNHELNAIGWAMSDGKGGYLRPHTPNKLLHHAVFLREVGEGSRRHHDALAFCRSLPLWFEIPGRLRAVHACWHQDSQLALLRHLDVRGCLSEEGLRLASTKGTPEHDAVGVLLRGPEITLGVPFVDDNGSVRSHVRHRWWDDEATTVRQAAIVMDKGASESLSDDPVPGEYRYVDPVPLLFGHYWMDGEPTLDHPLRACLDFGAARADGFLAAYCWSGEPTLTPANIVHVGIRAPDLHDGLDPSPYRP